jgi:type III pantothenate kinase
LQHSAQGQWLRTARRVILGGIRGLWHSGAGFALDDDGLGAIMSSGALAPGIEISVDALSRRAAQLLKVELTRPPRVVGKNTVEALQSGIVYGFAGQVEGIARRMAAELSPQDPGAVTVIATGGLAPLVIGEVPIVDAHEPWLTLIGLRLVWERNTARETNVPPGGDRR